MCCCKKICIVYIIIYLQVYTAEMIADVVQYGLERGVRVMPEFDAPAHVGEGWQGTGLTVCFKVIITK